jgi:hypothetical protein
MKKNYGFSALLVMIAVMLSGCMSFNQNVLPDVGELKTPHNKTIIQAKSENFSKTTNGSNSDYARGTKIGNGILKDIMNRWKEKEIISNYGDFSQAVKPSSLDTDYSLILSGNSDEQFSPFAARLTGATLFLIPSFSTVEQTVKFELINNKTSKKYFVEAKDSISVVMQLIFFPLFIVQNAGASSMHNHMADYIYSELYKQGAFN